VHRCIGATPLSETTQLHEVFGERVYFATKRIRKGRDAFVAIINDGFAGEEALKLYRMRWGIEILFSHLKRLCYQWERKLEEAKGVKLKSHGYRAKNVFLRGIESLHQILHMP
jgi:hypothetical protein